MFTSELTENLFDSVGALMRKMNGMVKTPKQYGDFEEKLLFSEIGILKEIRRNGQSGTGKLAELIDVTPSAVSQIIKRLRKNGYLVREHDEKNDSRRVKFLLTDKGLNAVECYKTHIENLAVFMTEKYKGFEREDIDKFILMMDILGNFNYFKEKGLE